MPDTYYHGVRVIDTSDGARAIKTTETAVIAGVFIAPDADATVFPLNELVLSAGNIDTYIAASGTQGTLRKSLEAIKDQTDPLLIMVRVAEGVDDAETISNIIGTVTPEGKMTGIQAFLTAQNKFGFTGKIYGAPGWDHLEAVANELVQVAEKTRGFAYTGMLANTAAEAVAARANFGNKRHMLVWPDFVGWDTTSNSEIVLAASARAMGVRAKIDLEQGWHKAISNEIVGGVSGLSKDVYWDQHTAVNDANYLNEHEITTIIRHKGYRLWGSRTCSSDANEAFESFVRTGDVLARTIGDANFWAIDKPMSRGLILDIIDSINAKLTDWTARGYLLGGKCWIETGANAPEIVKGGKLTIKYNYTPVPPLENLDLVQEMTDEYIVNLTEGINNVAT